MSDMFKIDLTKPQCFWFEDDVRHVSRFSEWETKLRPGTDESWSKEAASNVEGATSHVEEARADVKEDEKQKLPSFPTEPKKPNFISDMPNALGTTSTFLSVLRKSKQRLKHKKLLQSEVEESHHMQLRRGKVIEDVKTNLCEECDESSEEKAEFCKNEGDFFKKRAISDFEGGKGSEKNAIHPQPDVTSNISDFDSFIKPQCMEIKKDRWGFKPCRRKTKRSRHRSKLQMRVITSDVFFEGGKGTEKNELERDAPRNQPSFPTEPKEPSFTSDMPDTLGKTSTILSDILTGKVQRRELKYCLNHEKLSQAQESRCKQDITINLSEEHDKSSEAEAEFYKYEGDFFKLRAISDFEGGKDTEENELGEGASRNRPDDASVAKGTKTGAEEEKYTQRKESDERAATLSQKEEDETSGKE